MKRVIRRVYSSNFAESSAMTPADTNRDAKKARRKKRFMKVLGTGATIAAAGTGAYLARNTKAGMAVRSNKAVKAVGKFAAENGGDYVKRKVSNVKNAGVKLYANNLTRDGREYQKRLKGSN